MPDPFSCAANAVALLGVAAHSCQCLFNVITKIADAPADIQQHLVWLQALRSTFSELQKLAGDARLRDIFLDLPEGFNSRLQEALADLQRVERRVRQIADRLKKRGMVHAWARVKFAFSGDQWIKKFFERLQTYQATFTLDLLNLQIKTSAKFSNSLQQIHAHDRSLSWISPPTTGAGIAKPLLRNSGEWAILRARSWSHYQICVGSLALWSGRLVIRPCVEDRDSPSPFGQPYRSGREWGCGAVFRIYGCGFYPSIVIMAVFKKCRNPQGTFSLHWNLSFPRVVPNNADVFKFVRQGNVDGVRSIFAMGSGAPSDTVSDGTGLLHAAVRHGSVEMIEYLIQEGADVNARDDDGETPIHVALATGKEYELSRVLLENGADISSRDTDGRTPLHTFFNPAIACILTRHGSAIDDILDPNKYGMTILQYVSWSSKSSPEHFLLHLRQGQILPFVSRDAEGRSVLHFAAQRGNLGILNFVLSLSGHVDVDARDIRGQTPLHYAVQCKRTETIDLLVARGSRVRAIDTNGCTVLHCAAMHNNVAAIKRLLELGAADDLLLLDRDERTPFQVALHWKASKSVQYIMDLSIQGTYGQPTDITPLPKHGIGIYEIVDNFAHGLHLPCAKFRWKRAITVVLIFIILYDACFQFTIPRWTRRAQ